MYQHTVKVSARSCSTVIKVSDSATLQLDLGEPGLVVPLVRNLEPGLVRLRVVHPETIKQLSLGILDY